MRAGGMQGAGGMQCMQNEGGCNACTMQWGCSACRGDAVHEESIGAAVRRGLLHMHVAEGQWCVQSARGVAEHAGCRELQGGTAHAE